MSAYFWIGSECIRVIYNNGNVHFGHGKRAPANRTCAQRKKIRSIYDGFFAGSSVETRNFSESANITFISLCSARLINHSVCSLSEVKHL